MIINVKELAQQMKDSLRARIDEDNCPRLLIIQVGEEEASNRYVRNKMRDCAEVGIKCELLKFNAGVPVSAINEWLNYHGEDYDGIIIQQPADIKGLSRSVTEDIVEKWISPIQDVDGFGRKSAHVAATPKGIKYILERVLDSLEGKRVCVIGRGALVGMPLLPLLVKAGATVVSCNSHTRNLEDEISRSDVVVCATGHKIIGEEMREMLHGKIVVDAGIRFEDGKICGDVDKSLYDMDDAYFTTVPGGVGLMTRAMLLENTVEAWISTMQVDTEVGGNVNDVLSASW